jgi:phosphatidylglycerophosphate synthase
VWKFARDVLVNVIANLIAAAIIYLGAVAAGYVPASFWIVATAMTVLILAIAVPVVLYFGLKAWVVKRGYSDQAKAILLGSAGLMLLGLWIWEPSPRAPNSGAILIIACTCVLSSIGYVVLNRWERRQARALAPRSASGGAK